MKLKYAKVNYNNKLIKQDGTKEVSNFHVLVDVDQFDQNTWVASTYKSFYKKANRKLYKNLQVVIESLSGDEHYYFVPKQENKIISLHKETLSTSWRKLQVFKANNNTYYYYEPSLFDDDGKFQRKFTGHSTSGSISIVKVENELGENLGTITFEPSSLTVEEYEKMLKDLYRVHLSLLSSNDSPEKIGIKGKETLEGILINIREINESIQAIINNPNRNLELEGKIQSIKLINKFEPKLAIQKLINPGKNTFYINQLSETLATSENYLIKQGLTDLLNYLKNSKVSLYQERDLIENSEEKDSNVLVSKTNIDRLNENNLCNLDYNVRPQNRLISSTSRELREFFAMNKETEERLSYNEATFEAWRFGSVLKSNFMPFSVEFKDEIQRKNDFIRTNTITSNHVLTHYLLDQFGNWLSKQSNCFQIGNSIIIIQAEIEFKNGFRKISRIYDIFINNESLARPTSEKLKQWVSEKKYYFEDPTNDLFRFKASLEQKEQYYKDQLDSVDERSVIAADGIKEIEQLLAADIFKGIKLRHRMPNVPTQLFLHNPLYLRAWKTLQEINKDIEFYLYNTK